MLVACRFLTPTDCLSQYQHEQLSFRKKLGSVYYFLTKADFTHKICFCRHFRALLEPHQKFLCLKQHIIFTAFSQFYQLMYQLHSIPKTLFVQLNNNFVYNLFPNQNCCFCTLGVTYCMIDCQKVHNLLFASFCSWPKTLLLKTSDRSF